MNELTVGQIRAGAPTPAWPAEIEDAVSAPTDLWRAEEGATPRCYRDPDARAAWEAGAWCAIGGDPDETGTAPVFRAGYDWAARRALELGRWEAWNLALREVEERRPIARSTPGGVRYYGTGVSPPPEIARLNPLSIALWLSLHGMQGARLRWSIYRQLGVSDQDLALAISREFASVSAGEAGGVPYRGEGCRRFNDMNGGRHPRFYFGPWGNEHRLAGPDLVSRTRALLRLPVPGLLALEPVVVTPIDTPAQAPASAPRARAAAVEQLGLF